MPIAIVLMHAGPFTSNYLESVQADSLRRELLKRGHFS